MAAAATEVTTTSVAILGGEDWDEADPEVDFDRNYHCRKATATTKVTRNASYVARQDAGPQNIPLKKGSNPSRNTLPSVTTGANSQTILRSW